MPIKKLRRGEIIAETVHFLELTKIKQQEQIKGLEKSIIKITELLKNITQDSDVVIVPVSVSFPETSITKAWQEQPRVIGCPECGIIQEQPRYDPHIKCINCGYKFSPNEIAYAAGEWPW